MKEQLEKVKKIGMKPVIFVSTDLLKCMNKKSELGQICSIAESLSIPVFNTNNVSDLNKIYKAYVFRYGYIPPSTEAMIKKKHGIIVSGDLKVPEEATA